MKQIKTAIKNLLPVVLALTLSFSFTQAVYAAQQYIHDPMANPGAAKDIVVDPNAVYGYAPSPESSRLKDYVEYDWSNPAVVGEMRKQREEYHESMKELYTMIDTMRASGASVKDIAIAVSTRRNEIRLESYKNDPEGLAKVKKSNLENFGNENGGTPEFFYKKYGSWETVIEKSLSTNAGADACLGLYDKYYDTYFITSDSKADTDKTNGDSKADTSKTGSSTNAGSDKAGKGSDTVSASEYTVAPGDSLSSIAANQLGDKTKWRVIYDLNKDIIKKPELIYPGQVLRLK